MIINFKLRGRRRFRGLKNRLQVTHPLFHCLFSPIKRTSGGERKGKKRKEKERKGKKRKEKERKGKKKERKGKKRKEKERKKRGKGGERGRRGRKGIGRGGYHCLPFVEGFPTLSPNNFVVRDAFFYEQEEKANE